MVHLTKIVAGLLVLLALALGGYAFWLGQQPARLPAAQRPAAAVPSVPTFPVVVTSRPVAAGQPLGADMLRVAQLPINPSGALPDVASASGRVPVFDLAEGTPVMENELSSGLALRLAEGERAVAVKADEVIGVGNRVRPGDFVDVFFLLKADGREIERSQARLLLARQRVLAFGSASIDGPPPGATEGGNARAPQPARTEAARTAVLAVAVADVGRLALGEASGRLVLALRHPTDTAVPDPSLFAAMPTALQPVAGGIGKRGPMKGIDLAQAGLATSDLAGSGPTTPLAALPISAPRTVPLNAPRSSAPVGPRGDSGIDVEVIRGGKRETLSY